MGQSLGPEFTTCGGNRGEAALNSAGQNGRAKNFVEVSLERCGSAGVLDRCDLKTRWKNLEEFVHVQKPTVMHNIVISGGHVAIDPSGLTDYITSARGGTKIEHKVELPDLGTGSYIHSKAGSEEYIMALGSEDTMLPRTLRKYKSEKDLVEKVEELLKAGAQSLEVTIAQDMLCAEYDKSTILSELEKQNEAASLSKRRHRGIITSYHWMVAVGYKLSPAPDPLKAYIQRLSEKKTKASLLERMRGLKDDGRLSQRDIELFEKYATDDESITPAEQYMHIMVARANERKFILEEFVDESEESVPEGLPAPGRQSKKMTGKHMDVKACIQGILEELRQESQNMDSWQFMIDWETLQVRDVQDAMHEAQRHAANGNQMGYMRFALKAATLPGDQLSTPRGLVGGERVGLTDYQKDSIIAAGKSMIDSLIERFDRGELPRDRFEDQLAELCDTMANMVETNLLPSGDGPQHRAMCYRQMADYQRYIYVYVPKRRTSENLISATYIRAEEYGKQLHPRSLAGVSSVVNHAVYFAEVLRDTARAAEVCRRHVECGMKAPATPGMCAFVSSPTEVFNWDLLQHNLVAFETRFVLIKVNFHLSSWNACRDLVVKRGDFLSGRCRERSNPEQSPRTPTTPKTPKDGEEADAAEAPAEDKWPTFLRQSTAENWGLLKGISMEKARDCFESLQGTPTSQASPKEGRGECRESSRGSKTSCRASRVQVDMTHLHPMTNETLADLATVERWLESQPLNRRKHEDDYEDEDATKQTLRQVRWIDRAEVLDPALEVDAAMLEGNSASSLTRKKELWQGQVQKVLALGALRRAVATVPASRSFLVGCVVRLSPEELAFASRGRAQQSWLDTLELELKQWPGHDDSSLKKMEVFTKPDLQDIVASMGSNGVIHEEVTTVGSGITLLEGDALLVPDEKEHLSIEAYVKELTEKSSKFKPSDKETLFFQPTLQVREAKCMEEGPYTDQHLRFEGFRGQGNLQTSDQFTSFEMMVNELRSMRQRSSSNHSARLPPRRIRDLSARRSPIQAATRGCR